MTMDTDGDGSPRFATVNTLRPRQNGRHFTSVILKYIFLNENIWILIKISLKFVLKGPFHDIYSLTVSDNGLDTWTDECIYI